ncbi:MAG: type III pantothenate kinase [Candidatus Marinimicrobia bacterium]|nr:type III pantothenate kinase [Candidatus Neomarinimicrobiota bacterium]
MLLAIDIGNSNTVLALFDGDELLESWRLHTDQTHTMDDWWIAVKLLADDARVDLAGLSNVIIGSVAPVVGRAMGQMIERYLGLQPLWVNARLPLNLGLEVKDPDSVGADRLCNVVAARHLYGVPGVTVDLGTATTFDIIDERGYFLGGVIAPGIETGARNLFAGAALLSAVELKAPGTVIGKDTATNLQAGIVYGAVDLIDGMLARIQAETGWEQMTNVITGGLGGLIVGELATTISYDPNLTVQGLRLIYELCS